MIISGIKSTPAMGKINPMNKKKIKPMITLKKIDVATNIILIRTNNKMIPNKISI